MIATVIQDLLDRQPFVPFEIHCSDAEYMIGVAGVAQIVDEDSTLAVYDSESGFTTFVNLLLVQRVVVRGR